MIQSINSKYLLKRMKINSSFFYLNKYDIIFIRKVVKNMNQNDLNNQSINTNISENPTMKTNNVVSNEQITNQEIKPVKKKKYWLIPIIVFAVMVLSIIIAIIPVILKLAFDVDIANNGFFTLIRMLMIFISGLCGIGFLPSIIVAIVLSSQNKQK